MEAQSGKQIADDQIRLIWERTCEFLKGEMNSISFNTFIEVLVPVTLTNEAFILIAPNNMIKTTIEKYYINSIISCLSRIIENVNSIQLIMQKERANYANDENANISFSNLFAKYTFDTFVVGNSNYFAHAAALAVAQNPARAYNPLFIYGGVGLGKTHLMHAIGHSVRQNNKRASVMYVTSETFTNEMIQSISSNRNKEFRNRYRNVDVLLIDDIQFIAKKEGVQEEFFHTFNTLHNANKQIVISSDKPPREIEFLEERLRSRFEWGLIADIQSPDLETRIAILKRRAYEENCNVPNSVLEFIAEHVESNIRELEGFLTRVIAYSQLYRMDLNVQVASAALKDMLPDNMPRVISPAVIMEVVRDYFKLPPGSLEAKRRDQEVAFPRQIAMYISRCMTDYSLPKIGEAFGGRNHTTVIHAVDKIAENLEINAELVTMVEDIKKRLLQQ